jgi:YHS domain-containing protein
MFLLLVAGLAMAFPAGALAKPQINTDERGVAIKGYDPVAYFTEGEPVRGKEELSFQWKGARWLFSSREHMDLFAKEPERYAPRYGGY